MKKISLILLLATPLLLACTPENDHPWNPEWGGGDGGETPEVPDPVEPQAKPRYVWIDAAANFDSYANDADSIATDCRRIAGMGFTDIVVDVRPTCGDALFAAEVVPPLKRIPAWKDGGIGLKERTAGFD